MDDAENSSLLDDLKGLVSSASDIVTADKEAKAAKANASAAALNADAAKSNTKTLMLYGGIALAVLLGALLIFRRR
jgi:NaMN:DMB phosphoribosyltransferase